MYLEIFLSDNYYHLGTIPIRLSTRNGNLRQKDSIIVHFFAYSGIEEGEFRSRIYCNILE